jgi:hypothetical protein
MKNLYVVKRIQKITYVINVEAESKKEAELIAEDMGTINADQDGVYDTGWKAQLYIK